MRYKISHALVQFGGDVILRDVNFEVHDKEKIAIVGRNGWRRNSISPALAEAMRTGWTASEKRTPSCRIPSEVRMI